MRDLNQDTSAVTRVILASAGASMIEVYQRRQTVADQLMGFSSFQINNESHAATVVFVIWVIKALRRR
jgi:hypothetical protein